LESRNKALTAKVAKKFRKGRKEKRSQREKQNQSAILGVGRKLMAESAIRHPDRGSEFVYSATTVTAFIGN
jgi:hypothetical protein